MAASSPPRIATVTAVTELRICNSEGVGQIAVVHQAEDAAGVVMLCDGIMWAELSKVKLGGSGFHPAASCSVLAAEVRAATGATLSDGIFHIGPGPGKSELRACLWDGGQPVDGGGDGSTIELAGASCDSIARWFPFGEPGLKFVSHDGKPVHTYCEVDGTAAGNGASRDRAAEGCTELKSKYPTLEPGLFWVGDNRIRCRAAAAGGGWVTTPLGEVDAVLDRIESCRQLQLDFPAMKAGPRFTVGGGTIYCAIRGDGSVAQVPTGLSANSAIESCEQLKRDIPGAESGEYFKDGSGGIPSQVICTVTSDGKSMAEGFGDGSSAANSALSCDYLLGKGVGLGNGIYWVTRPGGEPARTLCFKTGAPGSKPIQAPLSMAFNLAVSDDVTRHYSSDFWTSTAAVGATPVGGKLPVTDVKTSLWNQPVGAAVQLVAHTAGKVVAEATYLVNEKYRDKSLAELFDDGNIPGSKGRANIFLTGKKLSYASEGWVSGYGSIADNSYFKRNLITWSSGGISDLFFDYSDELVLNTNKLADTKAATVGGFSYARIGTNHQTKAFDVLGCCRTCVTFAGIGIDHYCNQHGKWGALLEAAPITGYCKTLNSYTKSEWTAGSIDLTSIGGPANANHPYNSPQCLAAERAMLGVDFMFMVTADSQ